MLTEYVTTTLLKDAYFALLPEAYAPFDPLIDVVTEIIKYIVEEKENNLYEKIQFKK